MANELLGLFDHYTLLDDFKSINLDFLQQCFPEFEPNVYQSRLDIDDFLKLRSQTSALSRIIDHYCGYGDRVKNFCLFIYIQVVNIISKKLEKYSDIEFTSSHPNYYIYI